MAGEGRREKEKWRRWNPLGALSCQRVIGDLLHHHQHRRCPVFVVVVVIVVIVIIYINSPFPTIQDMQLFLLYLISNVIFLYTD